MADQQYDPQLARAINAATFAAEELMINFIEDSQALHALAKPYRDANPTLTPSEVGLLMSAVERERFDALRERCTASSHIARNVLRLVETAALERQREFLEFLVRATGPDATAEETTRLARRIAPIATTPYVTPMAEVAPIDQSGLATRLRALADAVESDFVVAWRVAPDIQTALADAEAAWRHIMEHPEIRDDLDAQEWSHKAGAFERRHGSVTD